MTKKKFCAGEYLIAYREYLITNATLSIIVEADDLDELQKHLDEFVEENGLEYVSEDSIFIRQLDDDTIEVERVGFKIKDKC